MTNQEFDNLKSRLKSTWMSGDYDLVSRFMEKDAQWFYRRIGIAPGSTFEITGCSMPLGRSCRTEFTLSRTS